MPVSEIMTPREKLITVKEGASAAEARALLNKHKLERLLVIDDAWHLRGPDHRQGHHQVNQFPHAARDPSGRLRVGAAVGVGRAPRSVSKRW